MTGCRYFLIVLNVKTPARPHTAATKPAVNTPNNSSRGNSVLTLCRVSIGGAIVQARSSENVCSNDVFLDDYKTCLECAGADNTDIWKYYSGTLSGIAESCGLPTTPEGNESSGAESTTSTGPTSTAVESKSSSSSIGITAAPTQSTTPTESSTTSETSSPAANGTATVSYADICIQHSLL